MNGIPRSQIVHRHRNDVSVPRNVECTTRSLASRFVAEIAAYSAQATDSAICSFAQ
jgi:hypothetical protein